MRINGFTLGAAGALAVAAFATLASAQNGFVEPFASDAANWRNYNGSATLAYLATGGPDGSGFARSTYNLAGTTVGGTPPTIIRAHASYPASGGAYAGNWIASDVTGVTFDIRHDLAEAIMMTGRFASSANFPGGAVISTQMVEPNTWTTVTFNVGPGSPFIVSLEGSNYNTVFSNIGNMQFGFSVPTALIGQNIDGHFDIDNVRLVPAPGVLALLGVGGLVAGRRRR